MNCTDRLLGNNLCPVADQRLPGPAACRALVPPEERDLEDLVLEDLVPTLPPPSTWKTWSRHSLRLGPPA